MTRVGIVSPSGETIEYPASLVGTDAQHDIAVLLVDAPEHKFLPVQVGTSADLRTGQSVYAIGMLCFCTVQCSVFCCEEWMLRHQHPQPIQGQLCN